MRKKVLILAHDYVAHFVDIYNQYTLLFPRNNYEVTVAYLTGTENNVIRARTLAEKVIFLDVPKKKISALKIVAIKKLLGLCRQEQFHIAIAHRYKSTYIMMAVAQFCKIPAMVFVMHELDTMSAKGRRILIAALARKNMLFAGVSNAVRDNLRKALWFIPSARIVTLHNMIDLDLTEPQLLDRSIARKMLSIPEDAFIFGNLARLAKNKDHATLVDAFALIKPSCPKAKLIILGKGDLENSLRQQVAAYGLTEEVLFAGFVPDGFKLMKAFDCFVLSSIQEAFGRVLLEAMAAKVPVIATKVHGIPEVVATVGDLVDPKDIKALAKAMQKNYALAAEERVKLSATVYQHVSEIFSIPAFQKQFWKLPLLKAVDEFSPQNQLY